MISLLELIFLVGAFVALLFVLGGIIVLIAFASRKKGSERPLDPNTEHRKH